MSKAFHDKVATSLQTVSTILNNERKVTFIENVSHSYDDKYLFAEFVANSTIAAILRTLEELGISSEILSKLIQWTQSGSTVSLRFTAEEKCTFKRKEDVKIESAAKVTEYKVLLTSATKTEKVITTVTSYYWQFYSVYSLVAFRANNTNNTSNNNNTDCKIELMVGNDLREIKTHNDKTPVPKFSNIDPIDINITYLLQQIIIDNDSHSNNNISRKYDASVNTNSNDNSDNNDNKNNNKQHKHKIIFAIDRSKEGCRTPRRNEEINELIGSFFPAFCHWNEAVYSYFINQLFPILQPAKKYLNSIDLSGLFIPIIPYFNQHQQQQSTAQSSNNEQFGFSFYEQNSVSKNNKLLSFDDLNEFLKEQSNSINEKNELLKTKFLVNFNAPKFAVYNLYLIEICEVGKLGIEYIENLLMNQLISAIGKEVTADDFNEFMIFNNRKLFKEQYAPSLFSFPIRRPNHYPEGILSIETTKTTTNPSSSSSTATEQPILTFTRKSTNVTTAMQFALNGSSNVSFYGDRYLHGYITTQFAQQSNTHSSLQLIAKARAFSSFILLIGRIAGKSIFEPINGIIIQNRDELNVLLNLEQILSEKEFKETIVSISPEQQQFATAFRAMQLNNTLFAVCVIHIKPQLEKVLNLPANSLTKEIKLTQDLLQLFIEYQLSSDLLAFSSDLISIRSTTTTTISKEVKVAQVKNNVAKVLGMINKEKERIKKELKEKRRRERELRELQIRNERIKKEQEEKERRIKEEQQRKIDEEYKRREEQQRQKRQYILEQQRLIERERVYSCSKKKRTARDRNKKKSMKSPGLFSKMASTFSNAISSNSNNDNYGIDSFDCDYDKSIRSYDNASSSTAVEFPDTCIRRLSITADTTTTTTTTAVDCANKRRRRPHPTLNADNNSFKDYKDDSNTGNMHEAKQQQQQQQQQQQKKQEETSITNNNDNNVEANDIANTNTNVNDNDTTTEFNENNDDDDIGDTDTTLGDNDLQAELKEKVEEKEEDYSTLPNSLNSNFEKFDIDASVRPTIIHPNTTWLFKQQQSLLSTFTTRNLQANHQKVEHNKAFDLLDALSKSGLLCFDHATLHVIVVATHCFEKSVINTVIEDNINPIEKLERTAIITASTIHNLPLTALVNDDQLYRVNQFNANLFDL